jgi:hypothetical protein
LKHIQSELRPDDGRNSQDFVGPLAESVQPLPHDVAQSFGHVGLNRSRVRWNVATVVTHD